MTDIIIVAVVLSVIALWLTAVALVVANPRELQEKSTKQTGKPTPTATNHQTMHAVDHAMRSTTGRGLWGRR